MTTATETTAAAPLSVANLPLLGAALAGGLFAGLITTPDGVHCAVVLLPDRPAKGLKWAAACKWAADVCDGGTLPTRPVAALLFANLKSEFERDWHWTSEALEDDGSYAWFQSFHYGGHDYGRKSYEGRARAVRLIPLSA